MSKMIARRMGEWPLSLRGLAASRSPAGKLAVVMVAHSPLQPGLYSCVDGPMKPCPLRMVASAPRTARSPLELGCCVRLAAPVEGVAKA